MFFLIFGKPSGRRSWLYIEFWTNVLSWDPGFKWHVVCKKQLSFLQEEIFVLLSFLKEFGGMIKVMEELLNQLHFAYWN